MSKKTYKTAVVLIPPQDIWEPIQAIDRKNHLIMASPFSAALLMKT
jgi:hypothetical protein